MPDYFHLGQITFLTVGYKVWTTLSMSDIICKAIQEQKVLEFTYDGHHRKVEPYCHGRSKKGKESLRGYQIAGGSSPILASLYRSEDGEPDADRRAVQWGPPSLQPE